MTRNGNANEKGAHTNASPLLKNLGTKGSLSIPKWINFWKISDGGGGELFPI